MLNTKKVFANIKKSIELLRFGVGVYTRKNLNRLFKIRDKIFFKKKLPESENYPYSLIDPFEVFGEDHPYGDFNLVGEDWKNKNNSKPLAILWGFNNWKLGFVSAYLPEYRTAFAPRKIRGLLALFALKRFPIKPSVFICWGYTESILVRLYAKMLNISILRMEDGFLRSSALGATHSTPYSLLLDSKGMHYNPDKPSDLEVLLNTYDFTEEELEAARECLELMKALRLSKYNIATLGIEKDRGIKTRRKVAVLGQVDNDMAMRLGNPDGWSMTELIRLAKIENPDADVYYRPHPDVYTGIRRSRFRLKVVEKYCKLASPEVPLVDFLETLDQVYTVTSLSGLEALLRGIKVTVVGSAFYAGWGLTDDRLIFPQRLKSRSVLELFAATYMKYPRYLGNVSNSEIGFKAACYRIKADIDINRFNLFDALRVEEKTNQQLLLESDYWPMLLFKKMPVNSGGCSKSDVAKIKFDKIFAVRAGKMFQVTLLYAICGVCKDNSARDLFIFKVRNYIDRDIFNELLVDLSVAHPGEYIYRHMAWLLSEVGEFDVSIDVAIESVASLNKEEKSVFNDIDHRRESDVDGAESNTNVVLSSDEIVRLRQETELSLVAVLDQSIAARDINQALVAIKNILINGFFVFEAVQKCVNLALLRFDYSSARALSEIVNAVDLYDKNRKNSWLLMTAYDQISVSNDADSFLADLIRLIVLKPDKINDAYFLAERFESFICFPNAVQLLNAVLTLDNEQTIRKSACYIAMDRAQLAIMVVENIISHGSNSDAVRIAYSQALSFAQMLRQAVAVMDAARSVNLTVENCKESLRLCVLTGDYDKGVHILREALARRLDLGDMHPRKIYFGARMVKEAFCMFVHLPIRNTVATYYRDKYYSPGFLLSDQDIVFLIAIFGPGDEIRFASIYNTIPHKLPHCKIQIACDPRLQTLFERSFHQYKFIPVARPRNSDLIDPKNYLTVPGSDLAAVIDDTAVTAISGAKSIMLVTDMLHVCLESYENFPGDSYLKHDLSLTERFLSQLPTQSVLIGLSWRSSVTTHSRNEHYLSIEELEPIFRIEGLQFVNFQYDECQCELDWVEARYPGKIINISEIDQYNDFESVAALMKCMDLMIAPATTVVELSGALGCPTWLLSNSSELFWRKIDEDGTDVWHRTITHVEGEVLGDKLSLVAELCVRLSKLPKKANFSEVFN